MLNNNTIFVFIAIACAATSGWTTYTQEFGWAVFFALFTIIMTIIGAAEIIADAIEGERADL